MSERCYGLWPIRRLWVWVCFAMTRKGHIKERAKGIKDWLENKLIMSQRLLNVFGIWVNQKRLHLNTMHVWKLGPDDLRWKNSWAIYIYWDNDWGLLNLQRVITVLHTRNNQLILVFYLCIWMWAFYSFTKCDLKED